MDVHVDVVAGFQTRLSCSCWIFTDHTVSSLVGGLMFIGMMIDLVDDFTGSPEALPKALHPYLVHGCRYRLI
jgi:hypothetical protein